MVAALAVIVGLAIGFLALTALVGAVKTWFD